MNSYAVNWLRPPRFALALAYAVAIGMPVLAQEQPKLLWSVSLKAQGYHPAGSWGGSSSTHVGGMAINAETVGVLLGDHATGGEKQVWRRPWELFLAVYDAQSGKALGARGPWKSGSGSRLVSTPSGKFLMFLAPFEEGGHRYPAIVVLLDSLGVEISRFVAGLTNGFLVSPSLRTVLIYAGSPSESRYRILDSETLETAMDWVETTSERAPFVESISDEQLLGNLLTPQIAEFHSGWKVFPVFQPNGPCKSSKDFRPNLPFFLANGYVIGKACESENEFLVPVQKTDGPVVSWHSAKKLPDYNYFQRFFLASQDGKRFALLLAHENKVEHWWDYTMDMGSTGIHYFVYIWDVDATSAIWRVQMHSYPRAACFSPPPTQALAIVEGDHLEVFSPARP